MKRPFLPALLKVLSVFIALSRSLSAQDFGFDILGLQDEDFFRPPNVANVHLSPDGNRLVYTEPTYDSERIHILDRVDDSDEVVHEIDNESGPISYLAWLDDDTLLYQSQFGDLHTKNIETDYTELVFGADRTLFYGYALFRSNATLPRVISTLPQDQKHILISAYDNKGRRRVYKLPLSKWDLSDMPDPLFKSSKGFDIWHADTNGEVRLAMKLSQRGTTLYHRAGNSKKWEQMSSLFSSSANSLTLDINKHNITQKRDYLIGFAPDPELIYFASNKETDTAALYLFDIKKGELVRRIAHHPQYDLIDPTTGMASVVTNPEDDSWLGIHFEADQPRTIWLEKSYQSMQQEIDDLLPDSSNLVIEFSQDESIAVVQALSSDRPPRYLLFERETKELKSIGKQNHPLLQTPGVPTQSIEFQGQDGHSIHGYFTPAKDFNPENPAPLVFIIHGGPWARDTFTYEPFSQCLANNGFSSLRFNFRGSTGYGFNYMVAAEQNYGWAVQDDIRDALQWVIAQNLATEDKVAIMGFSYGGYASALAAAHQPTAFQCAVPMSGIYDILYETKQIKKETSRGVGYQHWKQMVGSEWKNRERLAEISPINLVEQIEIPILLAHGTLDPVAGIEHAQNFAKALEKAGKEYEFIELEEEGHSLDLPKNQAYLFGKINDFLSEHLN
ncbi:alpha/beta hydrolase family protein [Pelagicoccus mobilis]|uniref:S9 family peptidase n=1 Tax=Pelagicoccus mobilis TaxID=415221 RepID=A0A934RQJ7_9BACT|nr:alpha/beta fold hydrolase [Pelagicoccus mobilis]MBK1875695.1 S9 family peptidase [Pelagicoccus mobilis]